MAECLDNDDEENGSLDLQEPEYINASYMRSYFEKDKSKQKYIATQAPKDITLDTFWKMAWLHKVSRVYCLTKVMEAGKVQAYAYWKSPEEGLTPKKGTEPYKVSLKGMSEDIFATRREFEIEQVAGHQSRQLIHYHTELWDDDQVPSKPEHVQSLVQLARELNTHLESHKDEKAVVHCSAGIGRTAVFLAVCDIVAFIDAFASKYHGSQPITLSEACASEASQEVCSISIFDLVRCLREQRWGSVKTFDQYRFLYELTGKLLNEHFPS